MGFLLVDKPVGVTSHDVIDTLRRVTGIRKIGHAGTLDPNATGLLVIGVGRDATKKLGTISKGTQKKYLAEICLGQERDTDDVEGKVTASSSKVVKKNDIKKVLKEFVGEIDQIPPRFSAIKTEGKKYYQLARAGKDFEIAPRKVIIKEINPVKIAFPHVTFEVVCGSGTYIRSLARDVGRGLGTYAYLRNLRRLEIGKYNIKEAVSLDKINKSNWKKYEITT